MVKETFPHYAYVSLENLDAKLIAHEDPRGFLQAYAHHEGLIIDEAQEVPALFSYMQGIIDKEYRPGFLFSPDLKIFLCMKK